MKQIAANFKLKKPSASAPTLIIMKCYFNRQRFTYSTGRKIHPQYWHEGTQRPITYRLELIKKEMKTNPAVDLENEKKIIELLIKQGKQLNPVFMTEMQNIANDLNRFEDHLISAYEYLLRQKETVTPAILKEMMDEQFRQQKPSEQPENSFYNRFDQFIQSRMKSNSILTIRKFNTLKTRLKEFEKKHRYKITFESIDLVFYDKFRNYLFSLDNNRTEDVKGLLNETVSKYFANLKTFMQWSLDRNYHNNTIFKHNQFSAKKRTKNEIVTITEKELMKLYNLDLSDNPLWKNVRDLFCFATFTGQRWSDIAQFRKEDVRDNWWIFESQKTKETMRVPLKGFISPALEILRKNNYELPKVIEQVFNREIKHIGEKAGLTESVTIYRYSGNQKIAITKPKHNFMSSHMARRSCVTILLQRGMPPTTIMKLTGHKDLKTLMKYENTSEEALVEALENI